MSPPFFSIVIPTRNRSQLLERPLGALLDGGFDDMEVIVSDNSDDEHVRRNAETVAAMADDRVRVVRPPRVLDMAAHWEWALGHAKGHYLGYVTDRTIHKPRSLAQIAALLTRHDLDSVSFRCDTLTGDAAPWWLEQPPRSDALYRLDPRSCGQLLSRSRNQSTYLLPRMMMSFTKAERVRAVVRRYGSAFGDVCPDFAFGMRLFDSLEALHFLDAPPIVSFATFASNGINVWTGRKVDATREFQRATAERLRSSYFPGLFFNFNIILYEYLWMREHHPSARIDALDDAACMVTATQEVLARTDAASRAEALADLEAFRRARGLPRPPLSRQWERDIMRVLKQPRVLELAERSLWPLVERFGAPPWLQRKIKRTSGFATVDAALAHAATRPRPPMALPSFVAHGLGVERIDSVGGLVGS